MPNKIDSYKNELDRLEYIIWLTYKAYKLSNSSNNILKKQIARNIEEYKNLKTKYLLWNLI